MAVAQNRTCTQCNAPEQSRKPDGACRYCGGRSFASSPPVAKENEERSESEPREVGSAPFARCPECGMPRWTGLSFPLTLRAKFAPKLAFIALALSLLLVVLVAFMVFRGSDSYDDPRQAHFPPPPLDGQSEMQNPFSIDSMLMPDEPFRLMEGYATDIHSIVYESVPYLFFHRHSLSVKAFSPQGAVVVHNMHNAVGEDICAPYGSGLGEPLATETYFIVDQPGIAKESMFYLTACAPGTVHVVIEMDGLIVAEMDVVSQ